MAANDMDDGVVDESNSSNLDGECYEDASCVYIPQCDDSIKPYVGLCFGSIEYGVSFYKRYALACGFDIRLGPSKFLTDKKLYMFRYVYCNREGDKHSTIVGQDGGVNELSQSKRRRVSMRTSCSARIVLKFKGCDGYEVSKFVHKDNHSFVSDATKMFQKLSRKVGYVHQKSVLDCARANIGPMKCFRFFKESVETYKDIGAAYIDFKNISRDLKAYVDGSDAQMVINNLCRKKEFCSGFYFAYEVDHEDRLKNLFWCDPISKVNFYRYGYVVSFDATYSTNRYKMIFAPFTGKDNHGKCVTFAAALITKEDVDSYSWLFEKFKDCMGVCPKIIVTNQDLGMKAAIERILVGTRHRLCMWHIMLKVPEKVPTNLKKDEVFNKRLCSVGWSEDIEHGEFELEWNNIMVEYGLTRDKWFDTMYSLRHNWIPAYFRDVPLSGLIKTTSISKSSNSFFGKYMRARSNLLEFFMNYESAIDSQRYANSNMNYVDEVSKKVLRTSIQYEKRAACLYTSNIFRDVQDDIVSSCFECRVISTRYDGLNREYIIADKRNLEFKVVYEMANQNIFCNCKKFVRFGLICSHMFCSMKNMNMDVIPGKYLLGRWLNNSHAQPVHSEFFSNINTFAAVDESKILSGRLVSEFYQCLGLVDGNREHMEDLLSSLAGLTKKFTNGVRSVDVGTSKQVMFEKCYGSDVPDEINMHPPDVVKTKGSGSRLVSRRENVIRDLSRPLRKCSICKKLTDHDKRNCGKKSAVNVEASK